LFIGLFVITVLLLVVCVVVGALMVGGVITLDVGGAASASALVFPLTAAAAP
jgi:hypothetical protein